MLKVEPHPDYPPEDGRYLRGNDNSPVAVAIILNCDADKIPPDIERLIRAGIEAGAAISGTVPDLLPSYAELALVAVDVALGKGTLDETRAAALRALLASCRREPGDNESGASPDRSRGSRTL